MHFAFVPWLLHVQERTLEFRLSQRYTMMMNGILQSITILLHKTLKCESPRCWFHRKDEREKKLHGREEEDGEREDKNQ